MTSKYIFATLIILLASDSHAEKHGALHERPSNHRPKPENSTRFLNLGEVIQSAFRSFPAVLAASKRREMAYGEKLAAEGGFDTIIKMYSRSSLAGQYQNENADIGFEQPTEYWGATFFGGFRRGNGKYPVYEGKSETASAGEVRAGLTVPLWRNREIDRRRATLAQAELNQIIASHEYDQQFLELERQATYRYWDWVLAGRRVNMARHLLRVAESRNEAIRTRIGLGDLPQIDQAENQRAVLERQERLVAAERSLEQAAIQLSLYLRAPDGNPMMPDPEDLPPGFPEAREHKHQGLQNLIETAIAQRPEIKRLETQIKQAEIDYQLSQNQRLPAIDLSISGAQDFGVSQSNLVNRSELYAGISIDLPVQQRTAEGKSQSAGANLARLKAERQLAEDRIGNEVRDAISSINASFKRISLADEQRKLALQLEEGEKTRYELGDSNLMLVNIRELATGDAALTYADALNSYHRALADYRFSSGEFTRLSEDVRHHPYQVVDYDYDPTS